MGRTQLIVAKLPSEEFHRCCPADETVRVKLNAQLVKEVNDLPDERVIRQITVALKALAHPLRLEMSLLLLKRDHCICELVQLTGRKPNLASHHLASMRRSGIVEARWVSGRKYCGLSESAARLLRGCRQATDFLTNPNLPL